MPNSVAKRLNGETIFTYGLKTKSLQIIYFIVHVDDNTTGTPTISLKRKVSFTVCSKSVDLGR
jgi:hypothetical protein